MASDVLVNGPGRSVFAREGAEAKPDGVPEAELGAEAKATIHVLIVDDEYTLRESCASLLRQEGYKVSVCESGTEAD